MQRCGITLWPRMIIPGDVAAEASGEAIVRARPRRTWRLFLNTLAGVGGQLGASLIGLVAVPLLVRLLGLEAYGLWALLSGLSIFVNVADLGLGSAFIKYTAEYAAIGRRDRVRQVVTFGVLFYLVLGAILVPIAALFAHQAMAWMHLSVALAGVAPLLLVFTIAYAAASSAVLMPQTLLVGIGYLRATSGIAVAGQVVFYAAALAFIAAGDGILSMVWASVVRLALMGLASLSVALVVYGNPFGSPLRLDRALVGQLLRFGGWIQINSIANSINWETDRIIIGALVGAPSIAIYELANKAARATRGFALNIVNPLLPEVSAKTAAEGDRGFASLYIEASKHFMLATVALLGFLMAAAGPAVQLWLGDGYREVASIVGLLAATYLVMNTTIIGATMLRAVGRPRLEASYSVATAIVNVAATILLARRYGLFGVVLGTLVGAIIGGVYFLAVFHRANGIGFRTGLLGWGAKLMAAAAAAAALAAFAVHAIPPHLFEQRLVGAAVLVGIGIVYLAILAALLGALRFFEPHEWKRVRRLLARIHDSSL